MENEVFNEWYISASSEFDKTCSLLTGMSSNSNNFADDELLPARRVGPTENEFSGDIFSKKLRQNFCKKQ